MNTRRSLWLNLCLLNLAIVAFYGFILRSKILFPLESVDYRNFLSAHSHFAFAGWVGLSLITLLIYELLPAQRSGRKIYQWILAGVEISSLGMAFTFPFFGYNAYSIFFSTLFVFTTVVFAPVYIKDLLGSANLKVIKLLSVSALISLVLSFLGTLGLIYILLGYSYSSLLYRDSIYTFLHFQYNGFFTLAVLALLFNYINRRGFQLNKDAYRFALCLAISIVPALFLSLLWHNFILFYVLGAFASVMILLSLYYFFRFFNSIDRASIFTTGIARTFWYFSVFSFALKMVLNVGTIFPSLGNAVYGDRPVIIGFLHLVFLGFVSFFLLASYIEQGYFTLNGRVMKGPFLLFATGIIANELILMVQGLGILLNTNTEVYKWLLWGAAILLFSGAFFILFSRLLLRIENKKAADRSTA